MKRYIQLIIYSLCLSSIFFYSNSFAGIPSSPRAEKAIKKVYETLSEELKEKGLIWGSPIFIRILKKPAKLEIWVKEKNEKYKFFKDYRICYYSGRLGPKIKDGDNQAPEGFYYVSASSLNPWSKHHLSFNLGYPNKYDLAHKRTGSALMVHGKCVSIGCYAMTNNKINEIYTLAYAALKNGQPFFRVHIFPFEMTQKNIKRYQKHRWYSFWENLKEGYDLFEQNHIPPNVEVLNKRYVFNLK